MSWGFAAAEAAAREDPGVRLFTVLGWDDARGALHRLHTSHPAEYPAGREKRFSRQSPWVRRVVIDQQPYLGRDAEAVAEVFGDHELIASLGCGAVINIPVVDGDRTLGVVNLLNAEGAYDEASVVAAAPLAALALEPLRAWRAGRAGGRATTTAPATRGPGMTSLLVRHARVLDVEAGTYLEDHDVLAVDGRVADVGRDLAAPEDVAVLDAGGATVVPGLVDAHVHVTAATADLSALPTWAPSYVAAHSGQIMGKMLERGFTTVRDAGGADWGLARAQAEGLICGPRLLFCGKALSQTGGHGDGRSPGQSAAESGACCAGLGRVADGVDAVRAAARDELRKGADHLKVMASGGVASPTDRIDSTQYSDAELRAIVEEADAANRPVAAHAYTARAIIKALRAGVRSIEHGNLLDDECISLLVEQQAYLVPTLVTYWALQQEGMEHGLPRGSWEKVEAVLGAGLSALERASRSGVRIAYGSDLLGGMHRHQAHEFRIRAEVQSTVEVLRSATTTAADLLGLAGEVGIVAPGARADLLLIDGDPLADIGVLAEPHKNLRTVVQAGHVVVDRR